MLPVKGEGEVAFYGGTFTLLPGEEQKAYLSAVAPFIHQGRVSGIRVSTRPDAIPPGMAEQLTVSGVTTVELGCQSFSAEVLDRAGRGHDPSAASKAVSRLRGAGLKVGLQLMPGLPGGDRQEAISSLESALALAPDFLRIYPTVVVRGTPLEDAWRDGSYRPLEIEAAVDWCAEMLWRCRRADIPVIRLGLQGTPELDSGEALVAGPYHPAFGQLVRSRLWLRALERGAATAGEIRAGVHPADLSDALGHKRGNQVELRRRFVDFTIVSNPGLLRERFTLGEQNFSLMELASYEG